MRAVIRDRARPSGIRLIELPEPGRPGPGQLLVRMLMAPVNPADRLAIAGLYPAADSDSDILGAEGIGRVEEVGPGIVGVETGGRGILMSRGNWTSCRLVSREDFLPVPTALSDEQGAMLRINPATASRLLDRLLLEPGAWLIQNAANSSVARWVRLLAGQRHLNVLNVVRPGAARTGIDSLVDGTDLAERASAAIRGAPIAGALDAVAGEATGRLAACLGAGGRIIVYGHLSGDPCSIPSTLLTTRNLRVSGFSLRPDESGDDPQRKAMLYADLAQIAAQLPEPVAAIFPLGEAEAALEAAAAGGRGGRILLRLDS